MIDLLKIKDSSIIICPQEASKELILEINKTDLDIKVITKDEFLSNNFFSYDDKAIFYLMNKGYSFDNSKELLSWMNNTSNQNEKLINLHDLKQELIKNHLLKFNFYYHLFLKNKNIYVYKYSKFDQELINVFEKLKLDYNFLEDENKNIKLKANEFSNIDDEVFYMFNQIGELIKQNIPLDQIKIYSYSSDYDLLIRKYSAFFNIKVETKEKMYLNQSPYFKDFLNLLDDFSIEECFLSLQEKIKIDHFNFIQILRKLISSSSFIEDKQKRIEFIKIKSKNTILRNRKYENEISLVDYTYLKDDYIFILGFNLLNFPHINKDVQYLNDKERKLVGYNTSIEENLIEEDLIISFLQTHSHLNISYVTSIGKKKLFPSLLIDKLHIEVYEKDLSSLKTIYSFRALKNKAAKERDLNENLNYPSRYLNSLSISELDYKTYDHSFKMFEKVKNLDSKLSISYSSIDLYNQCPFSYYCNYILKLNEFESRFNVELGNYFHSILENSYDKEIDVEKEKENTKSLFTSPSEIYFANKLLQNLNQVNEFNRHYLEKHPTFKVETEKEIELILNKNTLLKGKIDKIVLSEEKKSLFVVDYKTYDFKFEKSRVPYGFSLQLLVYSYLLKTRGYPNYSQMGVFIQNVLPKINDEKEFKLKGIILKDKEIVSNFESDVVYPSFNSNYFSGLITTKEEEFKKNNTLINKEEWDNLILECVNQLNKSVDGIRNGNFKIHPTRFDDYSNPCTYCKHQSICFKEEYDCEKITLDKGDDE